jgi:peptide deformylase
MENPFMNNQNETTNNQTTQPDSTSNAAPTKDLFIHLYSDKALTTPCDPITEITDELFDLAGKMFATMRKNRGVGLSANQVGVNKRFCVVLLDNGNRTLAMVNPVIISKSKEKVKLYEGCLSAPKIFPPVKRHQRVVVEFTTLKGEKTAFEMTDIDARIIQHELDHLDGKTVVDPYRQIR